VTKPKVDVASAQLNSALSGAGRKTEFLRALAEGRASIESVEASPGDYEDAVVTIDGVNLEERLAALEARKTHSSVSSKGGKARRRDEPYVAHAKGLAIEAYNAHPHCFSEDIVRYIENHWSDKPRLGVVNKRRPDDLVAIKCPSHRTLQTFVSRLRRDRAIPRRKAL
jgi:hypothetical protein